MIMRYNKLNGALKDLISAIFYVLLGTFFGTLLGIVYMLRTGGF